MIGYKTYPAMSNPSFSFATTAIIMRCPLVCESGWLRDGHHECPAAPAPHNTAVAERLVLYTLREPAV